mmetsp:Transcript_26441/g.74402  ORF Transcript_26441/g.74402 Transcript_26441/m.74402 type:complete len:108 (-) Transcript_26441:951-1274(-)
MIGTVHMQCVVSGAAVPLCCWPDATPLRPLRSLSLPSSLLVLFISRLTPPHLFSTLFFLPIPFILNLQVLADLYSSFTLRASNCAAWPPSRLPCKLHHVHVVYTTPS